MLVLIMCSNKVDSELEWPTKPAFQLQRETIHFDTAVEYAINYSRRHSVDGLLQCQHSLTEEVMRYCLPVVCLMRSSV
jgi:hypothetical protein